MRTGIKTAGWVGVVAALGVAMWGLYRLFDRLTAEGPDLALNQFLLPALSLTLVVLLLALAGVLIRNLVRLIVDRKRGILGARLRSKLVFFFLAFVLVPALILFAGSVQVIKQSMEAVLRTPLEELTQRSADLAEQWKEYVQSQALQEAERIAREVTDGGLLAAPDGLRERLARQRHRPDSLDQAVRVIDAGAVVARVDSGVASGVVGELDALLGQLVATARDEQRAVSRIDHLGDGLLAQAAVPLGAGIGGGDALVAVGIVLPPRLAGNLEGIDRAERVYRQFRVQRRELVRLYLTAIGLVFLVTLFVATWIGLYVARRITGPVQELATATREIAAGNLGVRVRTDTGDEIGMLVDAFNDMAAELQENRAVITRSTADLRRSNRALDERRRYIETLLANLSTAVLSLDPAGRVTTANPAVKAILGVDPRHGEDARRRFRDGGLQPLVEVLDRAAADGAESVREELSLTRGGAMLHVSVHVSPLRGAAGEDLGTLVMVEDLTELLRAQRAAAWREVARRIAHEIKNPLTPIQLSAQRLRKKFTDGAADLGDVLPEATASIEREVGALKRLVDEFSLFARLPEIAPRDVELAAVVESALALYRGASEVRWDVAIDADVGVLRVDPDQIRRALINLIDNAVAATDGRGRIEVRARRADADGIVRLEVADDGPGIRPDDMDKLFSPYFSTKSRGTGLGLAIVHKIVTDHRGSIRVEPNRPTGVRFVIDLPVEPVLRPT